MWCEMCDAGTLCYECLWTGGSYADMSGLKLYFGDENTSLILLLLNEVLDISIS